MRKRACGQRALSRVAADLNADLTSRDDYWAVAGATAAEFAHASAEERVLPDVTGINGFGSHVCQQIARVAVQAMDDLEPPPRPWEREELADIARALLYGYGLAMAREYAPDS